MDLVAIERDIDRQSFHCHEESCNTAITFASNPHGHHNREPYTSRIYHNPADSNRPVFCETGADGLCITSRLHP